jgi:hypothetical protein
MKKPSKNLVRTMLLSSVLASGIMLAQSFCNEAQATTIPCCGQPDPNEKKQVWCQATLSYGGCGTTGTGAKCYTDKSC